MQHWLLAGGARFLHVQDRGSVTRAGRLRKAKGVAQPGEGREWAVSGHSPAAGGRIRLPAAGPCVVRLGRRDGGCAQEGFHHLPRRLPSETLARAVVQERIVKLKLRKPQKDTDAGYGGHKRRFSRKRPQRPQRRNKGLKTNN